MTDVLSIDGLSTHLKTAMGTVRAIEDMSLRVGAGESVALVGESGCGKSMTALSIMRLLPGYAQFQSGSIRFGDKDLTRLPEKDMRRLRGGRLAMVFQDPMTFLNPLHRVGDQIAEGIRLHTGARRAEAFAGAVEVMRKVRLPDPEKLALHYPHQLSGGQRQRVIIAIAIACKPSLLICDEPTTALDVTVQAQIMELLADLRQELGTAVLLITHDLGLVAQYCSRVYVMYAGQIVEENDVNSLFANPRHPYTRALMRSSLSPAKSSSEFFAIGGQPPQLIRPPSGCRFHPRCPSAVERCSQEQPRLRAFGQGTRARCDRIEEMAQ